MEVTTADHSEVPCVSFIMSDWEPNLLSTKNYQIHSLIYSNLFVILYFLKRIKTLFWMKERKSNGGR